MVLSNWLTISKYLLLYFNDLADINLIQRNTTIKCRSFDNLKYFRFEPSKWEIRCECTIADNLCSWTFCKQQTWLTIKCFFWNFSRISQNHTFQQHFILQERIWVKRQLIADLRVRFYIISWFVELLQFRNFIYLSIICPFLLTNVLFDHFTCVFWVNN